MKKNSIAEIMKRATMACIIRNDGSLYILHATLVLAGVELLVLIFGFLLAIPTNIGKLFAYSASVFLIVLYVYTLITYDLVRFLIKVSEFRESLTKIRSKDLRNILLKRKNVIKPSVGEAEQFSIEHITKLYEQSNSFRREINAIAQKYRETKE